MSPLSELCAGRLYSTHAAAEDEINVPIALSAFRDKMPLLLLLLLLYAAACCKTARLANWLHVGFTEV